jgi:hypothetical protein
VKVTVTSVPSPGAMVIESVGTEKLLAFVPGMLEVNVTKIVRLFLRVTFSTAGGFPTNVSPKFSAEGIASMGDCTVPLKGIDPWCCRPRP